MNTNRVIIVLVLAVALFFAATNLISAPAALGTPSTKEPRDHKSTPDPCKVLGNCGNGDHGQGNPTKAVPNCHATQGEPDVCKTKQPKATDVPKATPTDDPLPTHVPQVTPTDDDTPPTKVSTPHTQRTPMPTPRYIPPKLTVTPYKYTPPSAGACVADVVVTTTVTTTTYTRFTTTVIVTQTVSLYRYQSGSGLTPR